MKLASAALVLGPLASAAVADPAHTVALGGPRCSFATVDAPSTKLPQLTVKPASGRSVVVHALAPASWCAGTWTLAVTGRIAEVRLAAGPADRSCAMCERTFTLFELPAGRWTVQFPGASVSATVR